MKCHKCKFYHFSFPSNACDLGGENFHEYNAEDCPFVNNDYLFVKNCPELGYIKGESATDFVEKGCKVNLTTQEVIHHINSILEHLKNDNKCYLVIEDANWLLKTLEICKKSDVLARTAME